MTDVTKITKLDSFNLYKYLLFGVYQQYNAKKRVGSLWNIYNKCGISHGTIIE